MGLHLLPAKRQSPTPMIAGSIALPALQRLNFALRNVESEVKDDLISRRVACHIQSRTGVKTNVRGRGCGPCLLQRLSFWSMCLACWPIRVSAQPHAPLFPSLHKNWRSYCSDAFACAHTTHQQGADQLEVCAVVNPAAKPPDPPQGQLCSTSAQPQAPLSRGANKAKPR